MFPRCHNWCRSSRVFLLCDDEVFLYLAAPLLYLDGCSLGSSSEADHEMSNCKVRMVGLSQSQSSCNCPRLTGEVADGV